MEKIVVLSGIWVSLIGLGCDRGPDQDAHDVNSTGVATGPGDSSGSGEAGSSSSGSTGDGPNSTGTGEMEPEPSCDGSMCWQDCTVLFDPSYPESCHRKILEDYEPWQCEMPQLCPPLEIQAHPDLSLNEMSSPHVDMDNANCFLDGLRGDQQGKLDFTWRVIDWQDGTTYGWGEVFLFGDQTALINFRWWVIYSNCTPEWVIKTQRVHLLPAQNPYYENCLSETDIGAKIDCILGDHELPTGDTVFPWLGESYTCSDVPPACPDMQN